jgi:hypothetical protein
MDIKDDPNRLLSEATAATFLDLPEGALAWRDRRAELALPFVWLTDRGRRFRYGDLLLVSTGKRPLLKKPEEEVWVSPFVSSIEGD